MVKFYRCTHCGQVIIKVLDTNVPVVCCGEKMVEIVANTTEAAVEKHIPVVNKEGNVVLVKVGSIAHPMTNEHYIDAICLETNKSSYLKKLTPTNLPEAKFILDDNEVVVATYAHCNLHSLWVNK